jgi:hypothetical protein
MRRKPRSLLGAIAMIAFVSIYALFAMVLAQAPAIRTAPQLLQTTIYAGLGLAWILPLMPLIRWMERRDAD